MSTNAAYACQAPHNAFNNDVLTDGVTNCVVGAVSSTTHKTVLVHIALCINFVFLLAPMPAYKLIEMPGQSMMCTLWKYC